MSENSRCDSLGTRSLSLPRGGNGSCRLSVSLLPVISLRPRGSLSQPRWHQKPVQKIGRTPSWETAPRHPKPGSSRKLPGEDAWQKTGHSHRGGPVRHPVAPIPYCTGFFDKITAETPGRKQDFRGGAMRERRENGRRKRKDWRTLLFFRPLLAPSGPVPGRPSPSLLLGERMRRPGPIPGGDPKRRALGRNGGRGGRGRSRQEASRR